jgi:8-oxo-dGTP pyrophosphatase MutT (NUDIX family)
MEAIPRHAARALVIDSRDRVLLFRVSAGHSEGPAELCITPGGGLESGDSFEQAALRELWEETGLDGVTLGPCVWARPDVFYKEGRRHGGIERIFLVRTPQIEITIAPFDPAKRGRIYEHRWWSSDEVRAHESEEAFAPRRLGELLPDIIAGNIPSSPIDTGP